MLRRISQLFFIAISFKVFALSAQSVDVRNQEFLNEYAIAQYDAEKMKNMARGQCPVGSRTMYADDLISRFLILQPHNQRTILDHCKEIGAEPAFMTAINNYKERNRRLVRGNIPHAILKNCSVEGDTSSVQFRNERNELVRWAYQGDALKFVEVSTDNSTYLRYYIDPPADQRVHYSTSKGDSRLLPAVLNRSARAGDDDDHSRTSISNFFADAARTRPLRDHAEVLNAAMYTARGSNFRDERRQFLSFPALCESLGGQVPAIPPRRNSPAGTTPPSALPGAT